MEVRLLRYDLIKTILNKSNNSPIVSNLGPTSDELWKATNELELHPRNRNFYTYGSMGLCSSIALGIAINTSETVISIDGDGSLLMNLGTLSTIGRVGPSNLIILFVIMKCGLKQVINQQQQLLILNLKKLQNLVDFDKNYHHKPKEK